MLDLDVSPNSTTRRLNEEFDMIHHTPQCEEVGNKDLHFPVEKTSDLVCFLV
jgi:hypothetical protein